MALYKRGKAWWIAFSHNGQRIQRSTGTSDKIAAQEYHDKLKADLWRRDKLDDKPVHYWQEAVIRWLTESQHKRSLKDDKKHLRWVDKYLRQYALHEITRDVVEEVALKKQEQGVSAATVNRMVAVIRAILRKAHFEWEWIEKVPQIRMRTENNSRIRWLTFQEAERLLNELPSHLRAMVAFTLATGLRASNVKQLQWSDVDMIKAHAWIHPDNSKTKKALPVPLNNKAMAVLDSKVGEHAKYVFTYQGKPVNECNTKAWRNALKRAGIENFRWHDLRHTWASWHVQNGTNLQELQQLGGWSNFEMVLRYAHLSGDHLRNAARTLDNLNIGSL